MSVAVLVAAVCDDRGGAAKREGDAVGSSQVANGPVARVVVEEALNVHHDLAARNSGCDGGQGRPGRPVAGCSIIPEFVLSLMVISKALDS